jgi:hypothetical protein
VAIQKDHHDYNEEYIAVHIKKLRPKITAIEAMWIQRFKNVIKARPSNLDISVLF